MTAYKNGCCFYAMPGCENPQGSLALYPGSLCSHSYSLRLFFTLLSAFPLVLVMLEALLGRLIGPYQEDQPISVYFLLVPLFLLSWEKISTLEERVSVEEFSSQALRMTTVSLSTYLRMHLLKWKRGWVVLNMFALGLATLLL